MMRLIYFFINERSVNGVNFNISLAKNDEGGSGHKIPFINNQSNGSAFNLTFILFRWAKVADLRVKSSLFYISISI